MAKKKKTEAPKGPEPLPLGRCRIEPRKLSAMDPAPYNPRTMTDAARKGLERSILKFGVVEPIVINQETGHVVGGHRRREILLEEGVEEADCVIVSLSSAEEKTLNMALNNQLIQGEFTTDVLSLISEIESSMPKDEAEDLRINELREEIQQMKGPGAEAPPEESRPTATPCAIGDLWTFGNHRMLIGDPHDGEQVERLIEDDPSTIAFSQLQPLMTPEYGEKAYMGTSAHKAGPVLCCHDSRHVTQADFNLFRAWQKAAGVYTGVTAAIGEDLANMVLWTLGTTNEKEDLPAIAPAVVTHPSPEGERDAALAVLAEIVAEYLNVEVGWALEAAQGRFTLNADQIPGARLLLLVTDIVTKGETLAQARRALAPRPHLAFSWLNFNGPPGEAVKEDPISMQVYDPDLRDGNSVFIAESLKQKVRGFAQKPIHAHIVLQRWVASGGADPVREDGAKWSELSQ